MYRCELPRVSPENVGIPSAAVQEFIEKLESCGTEMNGFMLARHGSVVSECWWAPFHKDLIHINHSLGKSYVITAVGAACTDGLLSMDDRIVDLFAEELEGYGIVPSENMKKLTVRHVATMTNGMSFHAMPDGDFEYNYLVCDVDSEPGSVFMYNTAGSCMLGSIVQKVTGRTVKAYLTERIFETAGIEPEKIGWIRFKNGVDAAAGVSATTENNLRLGLLYLNGGKWNGRQLLDPDWVRCATTKQSDNSNNGVHPDGVSGYGYQMWMCRKPGAYRFDGGQGQLCVMDPGNDMVIAIHQSGSMPSNTDAVLDIVHEFMTGDCFAETLPEDPGALAALRSYEGSRRLPAPQSRPVPPSYRDWNGIWKVTEGAFHVNPELRPFDTVNVYQEFYTDQDADIKTMSIYFKTPDTMELVINGRYPFRVHMDGSVTLEHSGSEIPEYYLSTANGWFADERTLLLKIRYIQTCFTSYLTLQKDGDTIRAALRKTALHDAMPYIFSGGTAKRVVGKTEQL